MLVKKVSFLLIILLVGFLFISSCIPMLGVSSTDFENQKQKETIRRQKIKIDSLNKKIIFIQLNRKLVHDSKQENKILRSQIDNFHQEKKDFKESFINFQRKLFYEKKIVRKLKRDINQLKDSKEIATYQAEVYLKNNKDFLDSLFVLNQKIDDYKQEVIELKSKKIVEDGTIVFKYLVMIGGGIVIVLVLLFLGLYTTRKKIG